MDSVRIIFKDDRDSSIGRGAVLHAAHFRPEMAEVIYVMAHTAPHGTDHIVVSEGFREQTRESLDLHARRQAFDFSLNLWPGFSYAQRESIGREWAARARALLGPDYDIVIHGSGLNLHVHVEFDPK